MTFRRELDIFFSYSLITDVRIVVGIGINYQDGLQDRIENSSYSVVSVKTAKGWTGKESSCGCDIAILKLNKKVNFILNNEKNAIMPACLPSRRVHNNVYNQKAYTAGNRYVHCLIYMFMSRLKVSRSRNKIVPKNKPTNS